MSALLFGLYGAFISRLHGGGWGIKLPKVLKNIIWAIPFGLCSIFAVLPHTSFFVSVVIATIGFALCIAGKSTGHGRVWNPFTPINTLVEPEKLEYVVFWLYGRISDFWYKIVAMGVIGFAAVSGAAIVVGCVLSLIHI